MHYRNLERDKVLALADSQGNFEAELHLSIEAKPDIIWCIHNFPSSFYDIVTPNPDLVLTTDASLSGSKDGVQFLMESKPQDSPLLRKHWNILMS